MLLCYKFNQNFSSIACIATVELVYDVSFLKLLLLIVDGDVESNPGPSNTPTGKQKGRKTKKTTFNFARKKLDMDSVTKLLCHKVNQNCPLSKDVHRFFCSNSNKNRHAPKHRHAPIVELSV